jgi:hypothetical protein
VPAILNPFPATRTRYTKAEYRDRVRRDLQLYGNTRVLVDADLNAWGLEAQDLFAEETKWFRNAVTVDTVADQAEYVLPATATGRVLMVEEVWYDNLPLYPITPHNLSPWAGNSRDMTGRPSHYMVRGTTAIRLWPAPSDATSAIVEVVYAGLPPPPADDGDYYYAPHGHDAALIAYGRFRGSFKDAHGEGSRRLQKAEEEWREALAKGKESVAEAYEDDVCQMGADAVRGGRRFTHCLPYFTNIQAPP